MEKAIKICTWNARSLYRLVALRVAARELSRCKLDLVGLQVVRWDKRGYAKSGGL